MRTGLLQTFWASNRIVTADDIDGGLNKFYSETLDTLFGDILYTQSGLFAAVGLAVDGNDKFKLGPYPDTTGMANGRILELADGYTAYYAGIQFENAAGIDYHIALWNSWIPVGVEVSPKDGMPRIKYLKETVGSDLNNPNSVVDNLDGTLTLVVDSVTEAAVSNAGRKVLVFRYPLDKAGISEALAWQECTVAWVGGQNKITTVDTPAGAGYFGQTVPSTTASDYLVVLRGPLVSRGTDYSADRKFCYLGTVKGAAGGPGNPPASFDTSGQVIFGTGGISNLHHITRTENVPPNRLKIDVKAIAAEEGSAISQIRVSGWDGVGGAKTVFDVDELGNVAIEGDLVVEGTTIQEDLVTVNASEIIADNLTLGDADGDSHLVKGTWWHRNAAETETWFVVDSATGHVGIGTAAHATYHLNVGSGGIQTDGHIYPTGAGKFLGNVAAQRWHSIRAYAVVSCEADAEADEDLFQATKGNFRCDGDAPKYLLRYDPADHIDERFWAMETIAEGEFGLVSYNGARNARYQFLVAQKTADAHTVDAVTLECEVALNLNGGSIGIDADAGSVTIGASAHLDLNATTYCDISGGTYINLDAPYTQTQKLQPDGDQTRSFGDITHRWQYLFPSAKGGEGFKQGVMPADDISYALGAYNAVSETGYRWTGLNAQMAMIAKSDFPTLFMFIEGQAADEGLYGFSMQNNKNLVLATHQDDATIGTTIWKVTRGVGTAVTTFEFGASVVLGAGFSMGLDTNAIDAIYGKLIQAKDAIPEFQLYETGVALNQKLWGIQADNSQLLFVTRQDGGAAGEAAFWINRTGTTVDDIRVLDTVDILPGTTGNCALGTGTVNWGSVYCSGNVRGDTLRASGDGGGALGCTNFTNVTAVGAAPDSEVYAGGNTNAGFIRIYIGNDVKYIPYWTAIT